MGEEFCASTDLSDEDACELASNLCLSWWEKRDDEVEIGNMLWEMSEQRINELATDPEMARAYLSERSVD